MKAARMTSFGLVAAGAFMVGCALWYSLSSRFLALQSAEESVNRPTASPRGPSVLCDTPAVMGPLVFDHYHVDLGTVKGLVSHRFTYANRGELPLTIVAFTTSCACSVT